MYRACISFNVSTLVFAVKLSVQSKVGVVGLVVILLAAVAAGTLSDPFQ